jgi:hypothetical protein
MPPKRRTILDIVIAADGKTKFEADGRSTALHGYANAPAAVKEGEARAVPTDSTEANDLPGSLVPLETASTVESKARYFARLVERNNIPHIVEHMTKRSERSTMCDIVR